MKKMLIIVTTVFLVVMIMLSVFLINIKNKNRQLQQINLQYEQYINKEIYGTELATLINKSIDNNIKYNIQKDENGNYIQDGNYSIRITIKMLATQEIYEMEKIFDHKVEQFIELFNNSKFKASKVLYHENTGRISQIDFEQTQE